MKNFTATVSRVFLMAICMFFYGVSFADSPITDTAITANVKAHLMAPEFKDVSVTTQNGVVSLSGQVKSETTAVEAVKITQSLPGVVDVNPTFLKSAPSGQPLKDAYINAKVQGEYVKHNLIGKGASVPVENINVEVKNGVVYLSGMAANQTQVNQLVRLARSVKDVVRVESAIRIP